MKNSQQNRHFHGDLTFLNLESLEDENDSYFQKDANARMTEQLAIPPASVWDRIEEELDAQDNRRNSANTMIASSFKNKERRSKGLLVAFAGFSVIAGIIWLRLN